MSDSLRPHGLHSLWNSPGQNTGVGSLSLLQGIFPTQGSNPGLPHCRVNLYQLNHKGSPRILEWVAYHFSIESSQPRNRTGVSFIAGRFFTSWATRGASWEQKSVCLLLKWWVCGEVFKSAPDIRGGKSISGAKSWKHTNRQNQCGNIWLFCNIHMSWVQRSSRKSRWLVSRFPGALTARPPCLL